MIANRIRSISDCHLLDEVTFLVPTSVLNDKEVEGTIHSIEETFITVKLKTEEHEYHIRVINEFEFEEFHLTRVER